MGEALLIKAVEGINQETLDKIEDAQIPVVAGYCTLVTTVYDTKGKVVPNVAVNCNDGGKWYNYHTNEKGKVIFQTNSGQANITAYNYSVASSFNIIDQLPGVSGTVDAPVSTKKNVNITLNPLNTNFLTFTTGVNNVRFQVTDELFVQIIGGGGGGGYHSEGGESYTVTGGEYMYSYWMGGGGGGGGAYNEITVTINRDERYNIGHTIGSGGWGAWNASTVSTMKPYTVTYKFIDGGRGGTTSEFGISAIGGEGGNGINIYYQAKGGGEGDYKGGNGGYTTLSDERNVESRRGTIPSYNNKINVGGGGGAASVWYGYWEYYDISLWGNNPIPYRNGGYGIWKDESNGSSFKYWLNIPCGASYGGGGGGGGTLRSVTYNGGSGGAGAVFLTLK